MTEAVVAIRALANQFRGDKFKFNKVFEEFPRPDEKLDPPSKPVSYTHLTLPTICSV